MSIGLVIIGRMILLGCNAISCNDTKKNGNILQGFIFNALFSNQKI
jgi:hypothetical protein